MKIYTLNEAKADQQAFIDKFGEKLFNDFKKAKDRLKNNNTSTDLTYHTKNTSVKQMAELIQSLYTKDTDKQRLRQIQGKDKEIRGKYNYLGEIAGYKVYQPLDVQASMDLGVNTGWCTAGRYGHYGHPDFTPSKKDAIEHCNQYANEGIELYYFLDPNTMYGVWAIAKYPEMRWVDVNKRIGDIYVKYTNFEMFNDRDDPVYDFNIINEAKEKLGLVLEASELVDLVIPDGTKTIESIKNYGKGINAIRSIAIPNSVTKIGDWAFSYCESLESISIPNSVISIGENAFSFCSSLTSINIPDSVTSIGETAFYNCTSLTSITIPDSVTEIGDNTFRICRSLKSIIIPDSVTKIGDWAFSICSSLKSIIIPDSVTSIGYDVFVHSPNVVVYTNNKYVKQYCIDNNIKCKQLSTNESLLKGGNKMKLNEESQRNIETFDAKFGEGTYDKFNSFKQRLQNLGIRTDLTYHIANTTESQMADILDQAENYHANREIARATGEESKGSYDELGEADGFKVLKINDVTASIYWGRGTRWCISGTNGSESDIDYDYAKQNWDQYKPMANIYFLISEGRKWAVSVYKPIYHSQLHGISTRDWDAVARNNGLDHVNAPMYGDKYLDQTTFEPNNEGDPDNIDFAILDEASNALGLIPEDLKCGFVDEPGGDITLTFSGGNGETVHRVN